MWPILPQNHVAHGDLEPKQSFHFSLLRSGDYRQAPSSPELIFTHAYNIISLQTGMVKEACINDHAS